MVRWICKLTEYSPDIRHISGSNTAADALSRHDHKGDDIKGNDPTPLLCMNDCNPTSHDSIHPFRLQGDDSKGYNSHGYDPASHDFHTKRLHPIDVSSDVATIQM